MCGIVGAVAKKNIVSSLMSGLKELEYRGYDSAGIAVTNTDIPSSCHLIRSAGKLNGLIDKVDQLNTTGNVGIGHTRWATHGEPSEKNAHPHHSGNRIYLVHNGIIDNAREIKAGLEKAGYTHSSSTDSEVIAHAILYSIITKGLDLLSAINDVKLKFKQGSSYALAVIDTERPEELVVACEHSPLVFSKGEEGYYIASDPTALPTECKDYTIFKDGDTACISIQSIKIFDACGNKASRTPVAFGDQRRVSTKGNYPHFMLKEIYEQPEAILRALQGRISNDSLGTDLFCADENTLFEKIQSVQIVACGGSYNAAMLGRYYIESLSKVPCHIDIASEYNYRNPAVGKGTLLVVISQSGETADVLAALDTASTLDYLDILGITNVEESTLSRKTGMNFFTRAGKEVGVASTKALLTQFLSVLLFSLKLAEIKGTIEKNTLLITIKDIHTLPSLVNNTLELAPDIQAIAQHMHQSKWVRLFFNDGNC